MTAPTPEEVAAVVAALDEAATRRSFETNAGIQEMHAATDTLRAVQAAREAAERDAAKLRRFLRISRDEGAEALENAERFKEERDAARRQVWWLTLFGAAADIEEEWRATRAQGGEDE